MATKLMPSRTHSDKLPSPGTPPYSEDDRGVTTPKGWCSERVPLSGYRNRRHVAAVALVSFSSGRALPSKWDDAERWISSPVTAGTAPNYYGSGSAMASHMEKRAKSKSGPLGPARLTYYGGGYNGFSPVLGVGVIGGQRWRNSMTVESPAVNGGSSDGGRMSCPGHGGPDWLDFWSGPPSPTHKDDNKESREGYNRNCNGESSVNGAISRRDMATEIFQESESSNHSVVSSPTSSISTNHSPVNETKRNVESPIQCEVKDVLVDKQTSTARTSTPDRDELVENRSDSTNNMEINKKASKLESEEARINAWENSQKAKAEEAIQKLEMKLEKKRSSSMEKIIKKLKKAENKAQKMRSSLSCENNQNQSRAVLKTTTCKIPSFCRKIQFSSSITSCSTCYPF